MVLFVTHKTGHVLASLDGLVSSVNNHVKQDYMVRTVRRRVNVVMELVIILMDFVLVQLAGKGHCVRYLVQLVHMVSNVSTSVYARMELHVTLSMVHANVVLGGEVQLAQKPVLMVLMDPTVRQYVNVAMVHRVIILMVVAVVWLVGGDLHATVLAVRVGLAMDAGSNVRASTMPSVIQYQEHANVNQDGLGILAGTHVQMAFMETDVAKDVYVKMVDNVIISMDHVLALQDGWGCTAKRDANKVHMVYNVQISALVRMVQSVIEKVDHVLVRLDGQEWTVKSRVLLEPMEQIVLRGVRVRMMGLAIISGDVFVHQDGKGKPVRHNVKKDLSVKVADSNVNANMAMAVIQSVVVFAYLDGKEGIVTCHVRKGFTDENVANLVTVKTVVFATMYLVVCVRQVGEVHIVQRTVQLDTLVPDALNNASALVMAHVILYLAVYVGQAG